MSPGSITAPRCKWAGFMKVRSSTSLPGGPSEKMTVQMDMADSTKNLLHRDAIATIKTEGLLGNKYVEVSFGSENAPAIQNGDTIKGELPTDFSEAAVAATNQTKEAAAAVTED